MPRIGNNPDRNNIGDVPCWRYAARRTRIRAKTVEPLVFLFEKQLIGIDSKYRRRLFISSQRELYRANRTASFVSSVPKRLEKWKFARRILGSQISTSLPPPTGRKSFFGNCRRAPKQDKFFYLLSRCYATLLPSPLLSSPRELFIRGLEITSTRQEWAEGGERGRGSDDSIRGRGSACIKNNNVTRHRRSWPGLMGLNQPLFFSTAPPVPIVLHRTRPRAINSRLLLGRAWVPPNNKDNEPIGE